MNYKDWYCVQVASGCEKKSRADLLARKEVLGDRNIINVEAPETTELVVDKTGKRKTVKKKLLPGYILVQVKKELVEKEDGTSKLVFPAVSQETIRYTANVLGFAGSPDSSTNGNNKINIFAAADNTIIVKNGLSSTAKIMLHFLMDSSCKGPNGEPGVFQVGLDEN